MGKTKENEVDNDEERDRWRKKRERVIKALESEKDKEIERRGGEKEDGER